jgi:nicotinate-nucleotide adenylyltransferase
MESMVNKPKKSIILFGGSFDPVHIGHINIVKELHSKFPLSLILVMPSLNRLKDKGLLPLDIRIQCAKIAFKNIKNVQVVDWTKNWDTSSTYNVFLYLTKNHPDSNISIAAGSDILKNLHLWKNFDKLLELNWVFWNRSKDLTIENKKTIELEKRSTFINIQTSEISSTQLRMHQLKLESNIPKSVLKIIRPWLID